MMGPLERLDRHAELLAHAKSLVFELRAAAVQQLRAEGWTYQRIGERYFVSAARVYQWGNWKKEGQ